MLLYGPSLLMDLRKRLGEVGKTATGQLAGDKMLFGSHMPMSASAMKRVSFPNKLLKFLLALVRIDLPTFILQSCPPSPKAVRRCKATIAPHCQFLLATWVGFLSRLQSARQSSSESYRGSRLPLSLCEMQLFMNCCSFAS